VSVVLTCGVHFSVSGYALLIVFFVLDRWQSPLLTLGGRRDALQTSLINNAIKKPIYTKRG
jgi:hypothetical protein